MAPCCEGDNVHAGSPVAMVNGDMDADGTLEIDGSDALSVLSGVGSETGVPAV